jgi:hypothetical protein
MILRKLTLGAGLEPRICEQERSGLSQNPLECADDLPWRFQLKEDGMRRHIFFFVLSSLAVAACGGDRNANTSASNAVSPDNTAKPDKPVQQTVTEPAPSPPPTPAAPPPDPCRVYLGTWTAPTDMRGQQSATITRDGSLYRIELFGQLYTLSAIASCQNGMLHTGNWIGDVGYSESQHTISMSFGTLHRR